MCSGSHSVDCLAEFTYSHNYEYDVCQILLHIFDT